MDVPDDITLVERAALAPGDVIAGKYVVSRFVGAGGMAQVFEALNQDIDERVAVKLMHPAFRNDASLTAKFRMEARSAARIKSEYVARVFDVVSTDEGDPVIVMEFLDGSDLRSWVDAHGRPSVETAVGWILEACGGLAVAHANGIVHRDVKPENLFVAEEIGGRRQIKLLDFGISRAALTHNPGRPGSGEHGALRLNGTPAYMAPEQITSTRAADPRMDVWAIGVLLWELLTGSPPFAGETPEETCMAILKNRRSDLRLLRPDLPEDLVRMIELCLAPAPEGRPPSVADVAVALAPFARGQDTNSVDRTVTLLRSAGLTNATTPPGRLSNPEPSPPPGEVQSRSNSAREASSVSGRPSPSSTEPQGLAPDERSFPPSLLANGPSAMPDPPALPNAAPAGEATKRGWFIAAGLLLLGAAALGLFLARTPEPSTAAPSASTGVPSEITVEVISRPAGAAIDIDGISHGETPRRVSLAGGRHDLTLRLTGHTTTIRALDLTNESNGSRITIELSPLDPLPDAEASASASTKKSTSDAPRTKSAGPKPRPSNNPEPSPPNAKPTVQLLPDGPSNVKVIQ